MKAVTSHENRWEALYDFGIFFFLSIEEVVSVRYTKSPDNWMKRSPIGVARPAKWAKECMNQCTLSPRRKNGS
jgi:hypothetical protein